MHTLWTQGLLCLSLSAESSSREITDSLQKFLNEWSNVLSLNILWNFYTSSDTCHFSCLLWVLNGSFVSFLTSIQMSPEAGAVVYRGVQRPSSLERKHPSPILWWGKPPLTRRGSPRSGCLLEGTTRSQRILENAGLPQFSVVFLEWLYHQLRGGRKTADVANWPNSFGQILAFPTAWRSNLHRLSLSLEDIRSKHLSRGNFWLTLMYQFVTWRDKILA